MAGGGGTRLWPLSRRLCPKQFLPLLPGGETLLHATVRRTLPLCPIERTLVVTAAAQVPQVRRCLPDLPVDNILVEPLGRNTAPCIGLAALEVQRRAAKEGGDGIMAVLPSDHHVARLDAFVHTLAQAAAAARLGHVVTIGVRPTHPETGYGYIHVGPSDLESARRDPALVGLHLVESFVEKPDAERARAYLQSGTYLWNAGTFFFPARRILQELRRHLPPLADLLDELALHPGRTAARYPEAPSISIDYAVMEHLGRARAGEDDAIRVVEGDFGWNDVGSFSALYDLHPPDAHGNRVLSSSQAGQGEPEAAPGPVLCDTANTVVVNKGRQLVTAAGVQDLIIAVTEDAILILPRDRAQDVRKVVSALERDQSTPDNPTAPSRSRYL